jgi:hypothetical protein
MAISKELDDKLNDLISQVEAGKLRPLQFLKTVTSLLIYYNGKYSSYYNPLHIAAAEGLIKVVQLFHKSKSCDFNAYSGNDSKTPLMLAAENGHLDVIKSLLSREGIDVNLKDGQGKTALDLAYNAGHYAIVSELINHGAQAGKENILYRANALQEQFNRMQSNNRAALANNKQPDEYERIRALKAQREALIAQRDAIANRREGLATECDSLLAERKALQNQLTEVNDYYHQLNVDLTKQYGRDLEEALKAHMESSFVTRVCQ